MSVLIARQANIEHRDKKGTEEQRRGGGTSAEEINGKTNAFILCSTGFTPLILAATAGHVGVVEVLLDKGGDIEAQSERTKDTPLSLACSGGRQEVKLPLRSAHSISML